MRQKRYEKIEKDEETKKKTGTAREKKTDGKE